jgi:hypothetical protein
MPEQMLSKWGLRIYLAAALPLLGWALWGTFANEGIPGWLNDVQADLLGGRYYPALTVALLVIPILAVTWPIGLLFDYATGQGKFAPEEDEDRSPL